MKKLLWIGLPVMIITFISARAFTNPDPPAPREHAMKEIFALADGGYRIGVVLSDINPHLRKTLKIDSGVLVEEVVEDGPAAKAGLKEGDIIVKANGEAVTDEKQIRDILGDMQEAKQLNLDIVRDGKNLTLTVTPEKRSMRWMGRFSGNYIGVELQELNADLAPYFQVDPGAGTLVARVVQDSPAEKAGMKSGDVITQFGNEKVSGPQDLREKLDDAKEGEPVSITVIRKGKEQKLTVTPEKGGFHGMRGFHAMPEIPDIPAIPDVPEMKYSMRDLEQEMGQLKEELRRLKLEDLHAIREEVQKQMEEVRKQLQELRKAD